MSRYGGGDGYGGMEGHGGVGGMMVVVQTRLRRNARVLVGVGGRRREWRWAETRGVFGRGDMAWTDTCGNVRREMEAKGANFM